MTASFQVASNKKQVTRNSTLLVLDTCNLELEPRLGGVS